MAIDVFCTMKRIVKVFDRCMPEQILMHVFTSKKRAPSLRRWKCLSNLAASRTGNRFIKLSLIDLDAAELVPGNRLVAFPPIGTSSCFRSATGSNRNRLVVVLQRRDAVFED